MRVTPVAMATRPMPKAMPEAYASEVLLDASLLALVVSAALAQP
jgi:hypothetical protein